MTATDLLYNIMLFGVVYIQLGMHRIRGSGSVSGKNVEWRGISQTDILLQRECSKICLAPNHF